jgi:serine/threonine protein kinase
MFHQEVAIMVMLGDYPHFCKIVGYTAEPLSIIMKYYSKGSLNIWMLSNKLSKVKMVKILKEVSKALQVMHEHHLAHCDIKTQNVLVEMENNLPSCFLSDFGITQVMSEEALATKAFNVINARGLSSPYASPESFINARKRSYINVDFKMYDLYSLACLMFEVITREIIWK